MQWFGRSWGAAYEADCEHVPTPVHALCDHCDERIGFHDDGVLLPLFGKPDQTHVAYHYDCHMRRIVGGLNHQMGQCTCCGGTEPPDPTNMSKREAARLAVKNWSVRQSRHRE